MAKLHEVITFDQNALNDMTGIQNRRAELAKQASELHGQLHQLQDELGEKVAMGADPFELSKKMAELRGASEALEAGVRYLENKANALLRWNPWMRR